MTVRKYKKGDRLVYPHHGACTVEKIEKMTAFDVKQDYLKLKVAYTDLVLMVPVANAESVGLRDVINDEEVEEVFAVLRKKEAACRPTGRVVSRTTRRSYARDIYQVAEVVRNLSIRDKDKGLSAGEKRMLTRARQISSQS